uniref:Uncharacterized protein n=1 Tax=Arundo donax TaxID=35708 RepID=A0A0A9AS81_ARUDO
MEKRGGQSQSSGVCETVTVR